MADGAVASPVVFSGGKAVLLAGVSALRARATQVLEMASAPAAALSAASEGRFRYNAVTQTFQVSQNAGAYATLLTAASGYVNGGNAFGANATIGLTDAFNLSFLTTNVARAKLLSTGELIVGNVFTSVSATFYFQVASSTGDASTSVTSGTTASGSLTQWINGVNAVSVRYYGSTSVGTYLGVSQANNAFLDAAGAGAPGLAIGTAGANSVTFASTNIARAKLLSTGELIVGNTYSSTGVNYQLQVQHSSTNAGIWVQCTTSTANLATVGIGNSAGKAIDIIMEGSTAAGTRLGISSVSLASIITSSLSGFVIGLSSAFPLYLGTNNSVKVTIDSAGNTVQGLAALATTATDGFIYSAGCAGTPTGVPTAYAGRAPFVIDTTNSIFYFRSGGVWQALSPGGGGGGWTDDGVVVRLTTSTDAVSIGSATENAKLYVLGDDNTQAVFRGDMAAGAAATIKLLDLRGNSGGTPAITYTNAGSLALFVAQADANPGIALSSTAITFGAGGASAVDIRLTRAAANVLTIDNAAGGAAFMNWVADSATTAAGRLGMDVDTGRPQAFMDGINRASAHTSEISIGPKIVRTMVFNAGAQTVGVYGMSGQTTTGSQANIDFNDGTGLWLRYASAGASGDDAGWSPNAYTHTTLRSEPIYELPMYAGTITDVRFWMGMFSGDPMASATPALHYAAFRYDTATDGTVFWRCCTDDGGAAPTVTTTTVAVVANAPHRFKIIMSSANVRFYIDEVLVATHTTDLPGIDTQLAHHEEVRALAAAAKQIGLIKMVWAANSGPQ